VLSKFVVTHACAPRPMPHAFSRRHVTLVQSNDYMVSEKSDGCAWQRMTGVWCEHIAHADCDTCYSSMLTAPISSIGINANAISRHRHVCVCVRARACVCRLFQFYFLPGYDALAKLFGEKEVRAWWRTSHWSLWFNDVPRR
jgi:hypothetical protein